MKAAAFVLFLSLAFKVEANDHSGSLPSILSKTSWQDLSSHEIQHILDAVDEEDVHSVMLTNRALRSEAQSHREFRTWEAIQSHGPFSMAVKLVRTRQSRVSLEQLHFILNQGITPLEANRLAFQCALYRFSPCISLLLTMKFLWPSTINMLKQPHLIRLHYDIMKKAVIYADRLPSDMLLPADPDLLVEAVRRRKYVILAQMLELGSDPNPDPVDPLVAPLIQAVLRGDHESVQILLGFGADPNILHEQEETPLHLSVHLRTIKLLVEYGADINALDYFNETPLHVACRTDFIHNEVVKYLIEQGAKVNGQNVFGKTPLHLAVQNDDVVKVGMLLDAPDINLELEDQNGMTAVGLTLSLRMMCLLSSAGADTSLLPFEVLNPDADINSIKFYC